MEKQINNIKTYLRNAGAGFAMGVANVIPGVSGGTMAFILGVFEELIDSIREFASVNTFKMLVHGEFKKMYNTLPWRFLLSLGVGVLIAFAGVAKLFVYLLSHHQSLTYAFFFGLILASIFTVFKRVNVWGVSRIFWMAIGIVAAYFIVTLVPQETPNVWWFSFLGGIIVICAMILPGISGSFLLLVLGQYNYVWGAVANPTTPAAWSTLFWTALGCAIGLGSFVHLLNFMFKKFHDLTVVTLIGFMIGSLWKLWPFQQLTEVAVKINENGYSRFQLPENSALIEQYRNAGLKIKEITSANIWPDNYNSNFWAAVGLLVLGFAIVVFMESFAAKKNQKTEQK